MNVTPGCALCASMMAWFSMKLSSLRRRSFARRSESEGQRKARVSFQALLKRDSVIRRDGWMRGSPGKL